MSFRNIREYSRYLLRLGKLAVVKSTCSPDLEIPQILREKAETGDAVLFKNVEGSDRKVLGNIYISKLRELLRVKTLKEFENRVFNALKIPEKMPLDVIEKISTIAQLAWYTKYIPKVVDKGPVNEIILSGYDANLFALPFLRFFEKEEARSIVNPVVIVRDPKYDEIDIGSYRVQVSDEKSAVIHVPRRSSLSRILRRSLDEKYELEVGIVIGAPPALQIAASYPSPPKISKFFLAGVILGEGLELVKTKELSILVPSDAEIVIEGTIDPGDLKPESLMGWEDGYYHGGDPMPVIRVKTIAMRKDAIYYSSIVDPVYSDNVWVMKAAGHVVSGYLRLVIPGIVEASILPGSAGRTLVVSITKERVGQAKEIGLSVWGLELSPYLQNIVIVDNWVNPSDIYSVVRAISVNVDPEKDIMTLGKIEIDELNPFGKATGARLLIDATSKLEGEIGHKWPERIELSEDLGKITKSLSSTSFEK